MRLVLGGLGLGFSGMWVALRVASGEYQPDVLVLALVAIVVVLFGRLQDGEP